MQRKKKGQALIELALSVLVFITIVVGIIEFGLAIYSKIGITAAAREGARVAVIQDSASPDDTAVVTACQANFSSLVAGDITIDRDYTIETASDAVEVQIDYFHTYITGFFSSGVTLSSSIVMKKEN